VFELPQGDAPESFRSAARQAVGGIDVAEDGLGAHAVEWVERGKNAGGAGNAERVETMRIGSAGPWITAFSV
jgi:hypothetical protein